MTNNSNSEQTLDEILQKKLEESLPDLSVDKALFSMLQLGKRVSDMVNEKLAISADKVKALKMYVNYCEKLHSQFKGDAGYSQLFCNEYLFWNHQLDLLSLRTGEDLYFDMPMLKRIIKKVHSA